jgi:hypothetical protein
MSKKEKEREKEKARRKEKETVSKCVWGLKFNSLEPTVKKTFQRNEGPVAQLG